MGLKDALIPALLLLELSLIIPSEIYSETTATYIKKLEGASHNKRERPVRNKTDVLTVGVQFNLLGLSDVNTAGQYITLNGCFRVCLDDEVKLSKQVTHATDSFNSFNTFYVTKIILVRKIVFWYLN